jgi:hypothetical protein
VQIEMMGCRCVVRRAWLGCIRERIGVGADEAFPAGIWGDATVCEAVEDRRESRWRDGLSGRMQMPMQDADARTHFHSTSGARCRHVAHMFRGIEPVTFFFSR